MSRAPSDEREARETRPDGDRHSLLRLLVEGSRVLEKRLHEGLRVAGYGDVRPTHFAVFRYLKPGGSRVTELAEEAGMTQQSMGELVDYLERRGYVERRPDPHDRRARIVLPTEAGRRGLAVGSEVLVEAETALAKCMGEGRLEKLVGSLEELVTLLVELDPGRVGSAHKR